MTSKFTWAHIFLSPGDGTFPLAGRTLREQLAARFVGELISLLARRVNEGVLSLVSRLCRRGGQTERNCEIVDNLVAKRGEDQFRRISVRLTATPVEVRRLREVRLELFT